MVERLLKSGGVLLLWRWTSAPLQLQPDQIALAYHCSETMPYPLAFTEKDFLQQIKKDTYNALKVIFQNSFLNLHGNIYNTYKMYVFILLFMNFCPVWQLLHSKLWVKCTVVPSTFCFCNNMYIESLLAPLVHVKLLYFYWKIVNNGLSLLDLTLQ